MSGEEDTIARLIAGAESSSLFFFVGKAKDMLATKIENESQYPLRTELRDRLEDLAAAIETILKEIRDLDISGLLRGDDPQFLHEKEMRRGLGDLADRVKRTLSDVPNGPGRQKYSGRPGAMTSQQTCALMVIRLLTIAHGAEPPAGKPEAQEACRALWMAAGGQIKRAKREAGKMVRLPTGDDSTEGWRYHLRAAKGLAHSSEGERGRRSLSIDGDGSLGRAISRSRERPRKRPSGFYGNSGG
jgi:hypothetical protein